MNASLEAARAGESGKDFAVVANEVRSLADGSKEATKNIQAIIQSILSDTEELLKNDQ
ncbi:methyl-accepting chemotaxis protein [Peribacillus frigoritolerans]|uniref:methyl-accepting chemotaxis protein n=1 Tax=Peribacillus frigoritolerans TaxID=450367 RepID=UPI000AD5F31B